MLITWFQFLAYQNIFFKIFKLFLSKTSPDKSSGRLSGKSSGRLTGKSSGRLPGKSSGRLTGKSSGQTTYGG